MASLHKGLIKIDGQINKSRNSFGASLDVLSLNPSKNKRGCKLGIITMRLGRIATISAAVLMGAFISEAAQASTSTCPVSPTSTQDYIWISVGSNSCTYNQGNYGFTATSFLPDTLLVSDTFNVSTDTLIGAFSLPVSGYDSYILAFQSGTGLPHPDYFIFDVPVSDLSGALSIAWTLLNNSIVTGSGKQKSTHTDYVLLANLYGLASPVPPTTASVSATPLPGAAILFGTVLAGGLGVKKWRRRSKAVA